VNTADIDTLTERHLDELLEAWAATMRDNEGELLKLWYPDKAGYLPSTYEAGYRSSEEIKGRLDMWAVERVNGVLKSLEPIQQSAIFIRYRLMDRDRVPPIPDYEWVLFSARMRLIVLLRARDVVL
jgi:hypothetical protein